MEIRQTETDILNEDSPVTDTKSKASTSQTNAIVDPIEDETSSSGGQNQNIPIQKFPTESCAAFKEDDLKNLSEESNEMPIETENELLLDDTVNTPDLNKSTKESPMDENASVEALATDEMQETESTSEPVTDTDNSTDILNIPAQEEKEEKVVDNSETSVPAAPVEVEIAGPSSCDIQTPYASTHARLKIQTPRRTSIRQTPQRQTPLRQTRTQLAEQDNFAESPRRSSRATTHLDYAALLTPSRKKKVAVEAGDEDNEMVGGPEDGNTPIEMKDAADNASGVTAPVVQEQIISDEIVSSDQPTCNVDNDDLNKIEQSITDRSQSVLLTANDSIVVTSDNIVLSESEEKNSAEAEEPSIAGQIAENNQNISIKIGK